MIVCRIPHELTVTMIAKQSFPFKVLYRARQIYGNAYFDLVLE